MRLINTVTDFFDPEGSEKWFETLQKAQFRGVPFAVLGGKAHLAVKRPSMSTLIVINRGLRIWEGPPVN
ncbi:hypothetical protein BJP44_04110 [Candidatus Williamhamiltonella defendens]|nr:hypothetical protein BJP44_04110 [Candidatus Hamiltonella defensa]